MHAAGDERREPSGMDPGPENAPTTAFLSSANSVHIFAFPANDAIVARRTPMSQSVLVVDDDVNLQTLLTVLLRRDGFDPDVAGDGNDGLTKILTKNHAAILLDLFLP